MKLTVAITFGLISVVRASYTLQKDFNTSNISFFDSFTFYVSHETDDLNIADPTNGILNYVDRHTATSMGLISAKNGQIYMGVDHTTTLTGNNNRTAVRIEATDLYTHGLFISDIAHMPGGICGTWPAWWLFGDSSPNPGPNDPTGEIDIIENANSATIDQTTLWAYNNGSCRTNNYVGQMIGMLDNVESSNTANCQGSTDDPNSSGCEIDDKRTNSFSSKFNSGDGGVYAMEWTSTFIKVFFFPRNSIPVGNWAPWVLLLIPLLGACPPPYLEEAVILILISEGCKCFSMSRSVETWQGLKMVFGNQMECVWQSRRLVKVCP